MQTDSLLGGRYRLADRLGAGGMSVLWRAHDQVLNRQVAVKVLAGPLATRPAARERIRAEAQAAARLWHPNVTSVYDYGESADASGTRVAYVVMELLPGRTLADRLDAGPLGPATALRICAEVASALAAAHEQDLVHRDVKPANVMLTPSGAKVFDFGIAAVVGQPELDTDGELLGTPAYLAPERLTGDEVVAASDVYALGLLIYRALTNRLPWHAETTTQMLNAHAYVDPTPLPPLADVPAEVVEVCNRCLAKEPGDRPSAREVADVLAAAAGIATPPPDDTGPVVAPGAPADDATGPVVAPGAPADDDTVGTGVDTSRLRRRKAFSLVGGAVVVAVVTAAIALADPIGDGLWERAQARTPETGRTAGSGEPGTAPSGAAARAGLPPTAGTGPTTQPGGSPVPGGPVALPSSTPVEGQPTPTPTPSTAASTTPASGGVRVDSRGGAIWVRCTGKKAQVLDSLPAAGYTIKDYDPGPADQIQVVYEKAPLESEIKVDCKGGEPHPHVKESGP